MNAARQNAGLPLATGIMRSIPWVPETVIPYLSDAEVHCIRLGHTVTREEYDRAQ